MEMMGSMWFRPLNSPSLLRNPSQWSQNLSFLLHPLPNTIRDFTCHHQQQRVHTSRIFPIGLTEKSHKSCLTWYTSTLNKNLSPFSRHRRSQYLISHLKFRIFSYKLEINFRRGIHQRGLRKQEEYGVENQKSSLSQNEKEPSSNHLAENGTNDFQYNSVKNTSNIHIPPQTPRVSHRPTKEELLSAATGFWSRLKVRFKWFSIRSVRPWNIDDWSAFVSWFVLGNIVWVLVGTTTFFSLVIISINTVVAQETLAKWIGSYLTHSSGIKVVFESAVVPKWKDGVITFHNVFVSRRPGQGKGKVRKGSSVNAAAAAVAAAERIIEQDNRKAEEEDTNYTQFDLTIATINVTLSFVKWWNGKGILRDVEVKGIRGVVDRTSVRYGSEYVDPKTFLHEHSPGDFEIDSFKMDDLLLTIYQPNGFRPFSMSIFSCDLPKLRKQWLFYDFLSADHMSGAYDGSLFTIHPHQIPGVAAAFQDEMSDVERNPWKKHSRIRIDALKIDHLNRGVTGPFGWIREGNVDIVADILFPAENDDSIAKVVSDFYDRMEATVNARRSLHDNQSYPINDNIEISDQGIKHVERIKTEKEKRFLIMELKLNLNEVRAAVPIFTRDLSYVNQTLIRPIVAYINNKRTFIPINCRIIKHVSDFDGSWTIFDSCLLEDLSAETYGAFAKDVVDRQARIRRLKKVGIWSISLAIQALFMGMAGNVA